MSCKSKKTQTSPGSLMFMHLSHSLVGAVFSMSFMQYFLKPLLNFYQTYYVNAKLDHIFEEGFCEQHFKSIYAVCCT